MSVYVIRVATYYDVAADSEEEALAILAAADERLLYYTGSDAPRVVDQTDDPED